MHPFVEAARVGGTMLGRSQLSRQKLRRLVRLLQQRSHRMIRRPAVLHHRVRADLSETALGLDDLT